MFAAVIPVVHTARGNIVATRALRRSWRNTGASEEPLLAESCLSHHRFSSGLSGCFMRKSGLSDIGCREFLSDVRLTTGSGRWGGTWTGLCSSPMEPSEPSSATGLGNCLVTVCPSFQKTRTAASLIGFAAATISPTNACRLTVVDIECT